MVPQIWGTILEGVPIIRIIEFLGSILGSPYFGKVLFVYSSNCHIDMSTLGGLKYSQCCIGLGLGVWGLLLRV